ncbi:MAG TPA: hypothetical protein VGK24_09910 [Candidatus Angelobacter sp.]|jgi:hypothetical protein
MTKQEIMQAIVGCAEQLGKTPSIFEMMKMSQVTRRQMRKHFGSFSHALHECNLERATASGQRVPLETLFVDWAGVVRKTGKAPSMSEYEALSRYSCKPLVRCFGSWKQVAYGLTQFAEGRGLAEQWRAELDMAAVKGGDQDAQWLIRREGTPERPKMPPLRPTLGPTYGTPMFAGPMAYAPVNEMGVMLLFGWMAPQLGYVVQRLQPEFPDCEAMRYVGEETCQMVKGEFEFESRNFLKHMHDVKGCDLIICWKHNWPECPIEVLELRKEIAKIAGIAKSEN